MILKWLNQRNIVVIPKSVYKARIIENAQISDFKLTQDEMQRMADLDEGNSLFGSIHDPEAVKQLGNFKFKY